MIREVARSSAPAGDRGVGVALFGNFSRAVFASATQTPPLLSSAAAFH
jgi:hypothetical protein